MTLFDDEGRVQISPSRLKSWIDCPLKWKAMYVDEVKLPQTPSLVFGTAVHKALEQFHRNRWLETPTQLNELQELFTESARSVADNDPVTMDHQTQGKELIALYVNRYGNEAVAAAEQSLAAPLIDRETGEDLGATLVGVIDLITADGRVVDVKTSSKTSDLFDLTLAHSLQSDAYRWLMQQNGQELQNVEIRLLVRKKVPAIESFRLPGRRTFDAFFNLCRRYVDFVRKADEPTPRPGLFCGETCPAYALCRAHHGLEAA